MALDGADDDDALPATRRVVLPGEPLGSEADALRGHGTHYTGTGEERELRASGAWRSGVWCGG